MNRRSAGFTLIELLIVIGILGTLAAVLIPWLVQSQTTVNVELDVVQLRHHYTWLELYKGQRNRGLPTDGGHKFVLATWRTTRQTPEDLEKYFTPGARDNDARYQGLRKQLMLGEKIWQDLSAAALTTRPIVGVRRRI